MKRILIIAYYFPPMGGSGVQRPAKFAKYLKRMGFDPVVLAPDSPRYHIQDQTLADEVEREGVRVVRVKGKTPLDLPMPDSVLRSYRSFASALLKPLTNWFYIPDNKKGWVEPALQEAEKEHNANPFDLVFVTGAPFSSFQVATEMKARYALPVVMDMRDDWLDSVFIRYPTPLHRRFTATMEQRILRQADAIVTVNEAISTAVKSRLGADCPPVNVIHNGFDPEDFQTALENALVQEAVPVETFPPHLESPPPSGPRVIRFLHNGLFYGKQQPDSMLKGVANLLERHPEWRSQIVLQFQGDFSNAHLELARRLGIADRIDVKGSLCHKDSIKGLLQADVLWFAMGRHPHGEAHTPGKLFEYMGSGKPILGIIQPGIASEWLGRYGPGFTADPENPELVAEQILQLLQGLESATLPAVSGEAVALLDRSKQAKRLSEVFKSV